MMEPVPLLILRWPGSNPVINTTALDVSLYIFLGLKSSAAAGTEIIKPRRSCNKNTGSRNGSLLF
jgi:hypothetical protein